MRSKMTREERVKEREKLKEAKGKGNNHILACLVRHSLAGVRSEATKG